MNTSHSTAAASGTVSLAAIVLLNWALSFVRVAMPADMATATATLVTAGLTITSAGTPSPNGIYTIQSGVAFGQEDIANEAQFIATYSEVTNGATTNLSWPLQNGTFVTFPTTAEFLAFAKAVAQFIAAVKLAVGQGTALLAATATIS
jgi:hypothetical protein